MVGLEGFAAGLGRSQPGDRRGRVPRHQAGVPPRARDRDLDGVTVAIQGVGHVGGYLCDKLHAAGAKLIVTDVNQDTLRDVAGRTGAEVVAPDAIFDADAEVFAPCALGGAINAETLPRLKAKVIAGAANNQLADARDRPRSSSSAACSTRPTT